MKKYAIIAGVSLAVFAVGMYAYNTNDDVAELLGGGGWL